MLASSLTSSRFLASRMPATSSPTPEAWRRDRTPARGHRPTPGSQRHRPSRPRILEVCCSYNASFVELVGSTPLTTDEWQKQREIYRSRDESDVLRLGFVFFFLNRTNRSGILNAGVIGGQRQEGKYKIDARFNRQTLVERLTAIGELADRITVSDLDGRTVIQQYSHDERSFMYIDPPYVQAGSQLYLARMFHRAAVSA